MRAVLAKLAAAAVCVARSMATVEARQITAAPAVSRLLANVLVCCPMSFDLAGQLSSKMLVYYRSLIVQP